MNTYIHFTKKFFPCLPPFKPQNLRVYITYNPQALSSALASLGCHSTGPLGYQFRRPLGFEV